MREIELRELLNKMTLKEKICQCVQITGNFYGEESSVVGPLEDHEVDNFEIYNCGSVNGIHGADAANRIQEKYLKNNRLGIPVIFMADIIHGCDTTFPVPLGLAASFNPENAKLSSRVAAKEASIQGHHVTLAPMCDLARDSRWGRVVETSGEDPLLCSEFSKNYVQGFQGEDVSNPHTLVSCTKHFAGYSMVQSGRDYNITDISERFLREFHFPAYKSAINAGSKMVMTAFNTINSIPCTGNEWLLRNVLRDEFEFKGVVISDWAANEELIAHNVASDICDAASQSLNAGCDMEMISRTYLDGLEEAIKNGKVDIKILDECVYNILKLKNDMNLFENPYRFASTELEQTEIMTKENLELAYEISLECPVLLKNNDVLPLSTNFIVTGPFLEERDLLGAWSWSAKTDTITNFKESFEAKNFVTNSNINEIINSNQEVIVYIGGEEARMSGESRSKTDISLPLKQQQDIKCLKKAGKKVILVLLTGRPLALSNIIDDIDGLLVGWYLGTKTADVIRDILIGDCNPSGKLPISFPYNTGQCPIFYNDFNTGRPKVEGNNFTSKYEDAPNTPLFSFGEGLNYSNIEISNININKELVNDNIEIDIDLKNTGLVGEEVIQIYVSYPTSKVIRPIKELKAFKRVEVKDFTTTKMIINIDDLSYYNSQCKKELARGKYIIKVGLNSTNTIEGEFIYD